MAGSTIVYSNLCSVPCLGLQDHSADFRIQVACVLIDTFVSCLRALLHQREEHVAWMTTYQHDAVISLNAQNIKISRRDGNEVKTEATLAICNIVQQAVKPCMIQQSVCNRSTCTSSLKRSLQWNIGIRPFMVKAKLVLILRCSYFRNIVTHL